MTLSIKQKALLATVGLFAFAIAVACLVSYAVMNVSIEVLGYAVGAGLLYFFVSMVYQVMLSKFEYDEQLKKTLETFDK